jgi:hypothetical protein
MDTKKIKDTIQKDGEGASALSPISTEEAEEKRDVSDEEINNLIHKYVMGEPIEKEYNIRNKIFFTLRSIPERGVTNGLPLLSKDQSLSVIEMSALHNNIIMSTYLVKFLTGTERAEDFTKDDEIYSTDSIKKRLDYVQDNMNVQIRTFTMRCVEDFQDLLAKVYNPESLVNF